MHLVSATLVVGVVACSFTERLFPTVSAAVFINPEAKPDEHCSISLAEA
jgi:hypothetical protein